MLNLKCLYHLKNYLKKLKLSPQGLNYFYFIIYRVQISYIFKRNFNNLRILYKEKFLTIFSLLKYMILNYEIMNSGPIKEFFLHLKVISSSNLKYK